MFKKDDYIVTLTGHPWFTCAKKNYIFKQFSDAFNIMPAIDLEGSEGHYGSIVFNESDWRYATIYEAALYDAWQKPVHIEDPFPEEYDSQEVEKAEMNKIPAPEEVKIIHHLPRLT